MAWVVVWPGTGGGAGGSGTGNGQDEAGGTVMMMVEEVVAMMVIMMEMVVVPAVVMMAVVEVVVEEDMLSHRLTCPLLPVMEEVMVGVQVVTMMMRACGGSRGMVADGGRWAVTLLFR